MIYKLANHRPRSFSINAKELSVDYSKKFTRRKMKPSLQNSKSLISISLAMMNLNAS